MHYCYNFINCPAPQFPFPACQNSPNISQIIVFYKYIFCISINLVIAYLYCMQYFMMVQSHNNTSILSILQKFKSFKKFKELQNAHRTFIVMRNSALLSYNTLPFKLLC